jgi:AcrR family transcriptional regulator
MPKTLETNRKARILDAAEKAFADFGFAGASLRHIVRGARVNLATVYYYFGSKQGLMKAVLTRRFSSLKQEQLDLLEKAGREAGGRPPPVEKILEAILLPPLRLTATAPAKRRAVTRLIGRIASEPNPQTQAVLRSQHEDARRAFLEAMHRSLPAVPMADLRWRLEFIWGALAFTLCNPHNIEKETHGACDPVDTKRVLAQMIAFFSSGLRAPAKSQ